MKRTVNSPAVSLTFEAGGDVQIAASILDVLLANGVPSTVFLLGKWAAANPELVQRMAVEGNELGNHSFSHLRLTDLKDEEIRQELHRTSEIAKNITGQLAKPWLRPPFGDWNERVEHVTAADGYRPILRHAVDGKHWPGETTPATILNRIIHTAHDGSVYAFHLDNSLTLQILPEIIRNLRSAGYALLTLSELKPYADTSAR
jgi:peptidoglycan/xylan/chitin deacetylase (PgdA/CDA1 family)